MKTSPPLCWVACPARAIVYRESIALCDSTMVGAGELAPIREALLDRRLWGHEFWATYLLTEELEVLPGPVLTYAGADSGEFGPDNAQCAGLEHFPRIQAALLQVLGRLEYTVNDRAE